jgi:D-sedoheptulose 7-phosphate isomerase
MIKDNQDLDTKFLDDYWKRYQKLLIESRNDASIICLRDSIKNTKLAGGRILFFGNGASASLCSHAATDFTKQANILSIAFNDHNLITALSNDYGYDQWVYKAIQYYSNSNDMIFFISVSGESINLLNGIDLANLRNQKTVSLTGSKKNNTLRSKSNLSLWVDSKAYNIVESIHTIWITLIIDMIVGHPEYSVKD